MSDNILANNQGMYDTTTGTMTYANGTNNRSMEDYYENGYDYSGNSNSKLLKGVLIGAAVGGVLAMLDSNTRSKVKDKAVNVKDTSMNVISEVKNNPSDVKDQMMNSFKEASQVLKDAISDAQNLYQRLNDDVFSKMGDVKSLSNEAMNTATEAKEDLKEIGTKVKEAGETAMDNPVVNSATSNGSSSKSSSSSNAADAYATGMRSQPADTPGLGNTANTFSVPPENQNNDNNR
ncbi:YtxH domain-containing protein [Bacillus sp. REN3]|uniref:YtxH domain-containing protein n=1 Tax=Bacillus sp. REN3 TaxID=2802440 RepID=UPI001FF0231E|nr:YtxH domain-containing protein [Bacillus sp. REN3]